MWKAQVITVREWLAALGLSCLVWLGFVYATGNLTDGPRIVDDNQLGRLQIELREHGLWKSILGEIRTRTESYRRFVPVFNAHKVMQGWALGTNTVAWSVYTATMVAVIGALLYGFSRRSGLRVFPSLVFAAIVLVGHQSVIAWKLIHGEHLGLLFLALSMNFMLSSASSSPGRMWLWETLFVGCGVAAGLCKESYLLVLPALACWRGWQQWRGGRRLLAVVPQAVVLVGVSAAIALFIVRGLQVTHFKYTGWFGFHELLLLRAALQFSLASNGPIILGLLGLFLVLLMAARKRGAAEARDCWQELGFLIGLVAVVVVPQLLLYMSSGFYVADSAIYAGRYLVPAMIAPAQLVAFLLDRSKLLLSRGFDSATHRRLAYAVFVLLVGLLLGMRTSSAYQDARSFAEESRSYDRWFAQIQSHCKSEDAILIVYRNSGERIPVRIDFLLAEILGYQNLYYEKYPLEPLDDYDPPTSDITHFFEQMRSADELVDKSRIGTVLIAELKEWEDVFAAEAANDWFDQDDFHKLPSNFGYTAYFRKQRSDQR